MLLWLVSGKQPFRRRKGASGRQSASVGASSSPRSLGQRGHISRLGSRGYLHRRAMHQCARSEARERQEAGAAVDPTEVNRLAVGQTVGQPAHTVANIGDPPHAADATLIPIPKQRFCPDTEEVTGSNPVSPTSCFPCQQGIRRGPRTAVRPDYDEAILSPAPPIRWARPA
jgi:hypothetical protein